MTDQPDLSRADATRARLLKAAVTAFADKGFHGTTTRDIASAAGMSPAALYVHHKSKEELLYLIAKEGHDAVLTLIREAIGSTDSPVDALRRVIRDFSAHHARGHVGARVVNYELAALAPDHLAEIRGLRHEIEDEIRSLVARGVNAGDFDTVDPRIAAAALLSLGVDLARWYRDGGSWTPEEIGEQYAGMALRIVGARDAG
jgi:AcrR family transcriptional regulator